MYNVTRSNLQRSSIQDRGSACFVLQPEIIL